MPKPVSKEEVAEDLRRVIDELGEPPTYDEYNKHGRYSSWTAAKKFSTWSDALRAVGHGPHIQYSVSSEDLISDLNTVASDLGRTPSKSDYREHGEFAPRTVRLEFGSWNEGATAAGLTPNKKKTKISDKDLLQDLRAEADGHTAPARSNYEQTGKYHPWTIINRFDGWWKACVQAGLQPRSKHPLCPEAVHKFKTTAESLPPPGAVHALLFLFTPLPTHIAEEFESDWMANRRESVVEVPSKYLHGDEPWPFRIPATWKNPHTESEEPTNLPELLKWYWEFNNTLQLADSNLAYHISRLAERAGLADRPTVNRPPLGEVPRVHPEDLRMTQGVLLGARGVSSNTIHRRLGIDRTGWDLDIEEIYLWLYTHEDLTHPEYDPPDIVLNSD